MSQTRPILVLYSGGRDSSATAVEMARMGYRVKLFTFQTGLSELIGPRGDSAPEIRMQEIRRVFQYLVDGERVIEGNPYLVRKLGIEKTNVRHIVYPIALALAVHCGAIQYCLRSGLNAVASGYSGYQSRKEIYIEQRHDFVALTRDFLGEYGISYHTPVIEKSESEIKDILERHGISSNSLENKSLFGGVYFEAQYAHDYWESCIPVCREYLRNVRRN